MNQICLSNNCLPVISDLDYLVAQEDFVHADRVAPFHVLIYVVSGCIHVTEDGEDYHIQPGELLLLKAGVHHWGQETIRKGTGWYYVHFYLPDPLEGSDSDCEPRIFVPSVERPGAYTKQHFLTLLPQYVKNVDGATDRRIRDLRHYYYSGEADKTWYANERLFRLLSHLALSNHTESKREKGSAERIAEYLMEHYREDLDLSELEKVMYMSYQRMAAIFREDRHMSMGAYVQKLRMEEAARLLRSTLLPVGEIGNMAGYNDRLYFSKLFRRHFGMSPVAYRKQPGRY